MAFKLRSQSPIRQEDPMSRFKKPDPRIQKSLDKSSKVVDESKKNKKQIYIGDKIKQDRQRFADENPVLNSVIQFADPTGTTSYGDVNKAWNDKKLDSSDFIEPVGALPVIGKIGKLFKAGQSVNEVINVANKVNKVNKAISSTNKANKLANAEKIGEAVGQSALKQKKSPLLKQKLSPKAAKAKAARDLAYAKTDDRRIKKAHSQRMHRKSPGNKGMDYDHEDGRFESVKQNRGNEGEGTKKESGKKYKIK
jgi:hypothetical protein